MRSRNIITFQRGSFSLLFVCLFLVLAVSDAKETTREEQWQLVQENKIPDILRTIAAAITSNRERVTTWQGQMKFADAKHYRGRSAEKMREHFDNLGTVPSGIIKKVHGTIDFAVDCEKDLLFTDFHGSKADYEAIDTRQKLSRRSSEWNQTSILTSECYMHLNHNAMYGPSDASFVTQGTYSGKAAFIKKTKDGKDMFQATVVDPRESCKYGTPTERVLNGTADWIESSGTRVGPYLNTLEEMEAPSGKQYRLILYAHPGNEIYAKMEMIFDNRVGLNLISVKTSAVEGPIDDEKTWTYQEIDGCIVPKTVVKRIYDEKGKNISFERQIEFVMHILNEPIPTEVFTYRNLGLKNGERLIDKIRDVEHIYQDGNLIPTTDELVEVAHQGALDDMPTSNIPEKMVFIPKMSIAIKKDGPFIFDLASCSLVSVPIEDKLNTERFYKYLTQLGKGDIAWDVSILTTRGTLANTIKQEMHRPLERKIGRWSNSYKLPENIKTPYSFFVVTKEGTPYLIKIIEIKAAGIKITYKKLNIEEVKQYRPFEKKGK